MTEYVVVVEADFRRGNPNYKIRHSQPLPRDEAEQLFQRVIRGEDETLLKPKSNALLARVSDTQVLRFAVALTGSEALDRITLAEVLA